MYWIIYTFEGFRMKGFFILRALWALLRCGKQHVRAWDMKSGLWYWECCDPSPTLEHKREAKLLVTTSDRPVSGSCLSESPWRRIETGHNGRGWKENNGERRRKSARSAALHPSVTTLGQSVARAARPFFVGTLFGCRLFVPLKSRVVYDNSNRASF